MEITTSVRVVCCTRPPISALPHVVELLAAYADVSSQWDLSRAAGRGFVHLVRRLIRLKDGDVDTRTLSLLAEIRTAMRAAAKHGHLEVARVLCARYPGAAIDEDAVLEAARQGHVALLQWLRPKLRVLPQRLRMDGFFGARTLTAAAEEGQLAAIRWLLMNRGEDCVAGPTGCLCVVAHCLFGYPQVPVRSTGVHCAAAKGGHLHVVRWLRTYSRELIEPHAMEEAATAGHLDVLQFLHDRWPSSRCARNRSSCMTTKAAMDCAATNGHLEVVQWLHANRSEGCTTAAMNGTARNGHLDIVQWLHENNDEGCTKKAMDAAAKRGHLEIVQFLHWYRGEGCTFSAMEWAATNGHLEIVQFLHANRDEGCSRNTMNKAAKYGHFYVVQWLHENRMEGCTAAAMDAAASFGHLDIVRFLHENRSEGCTVNAMDGAAERNHLEVVKWLHEHRGEGCSTRAMDDAATNGHLSVVQFLHAHRTEGSTVRAMDGAASNDHLAVVAWLHENRTEGCTTDAMDGAAGNHNLDVIQFLHANRSEGRTVRAMAMAVVRGDLTMLEWLRANPLWSLDDWSTIASRSAVEHNHVEVVHWLFQHFFTGMAETTKFLHQSAFHHRRPHIAAYLDERWTIDM